MIFRTGRKHSKGFTLIEVMVVVAIIAILGSLVTVSVIQIRKNAEKKAANNALSTYWTKTNEAFRALNMNVMQSSDFKRTVLTYLGKDSKEVTIDKTACQSLSKGNVYIQYKEDKDSLTQRYTLVKIWINYQGNIYSTSDGKNCSPPSKTPN